MEEDNDGPKEDPEDRMKTSQPCSSPMELKDMLLMRRSLCSLLDVDDVFEIRHVFLICSDIEDGRHRLGQLDWQLLYGGAQPGELLDVTLVCEDGGT